MAETPISKIDAYWPIKAAVWRNKNREGRVWYSVTFERSYKDAEGNYKSSDSYSGEDLLLLQKVAGLAHSEVYKLMAADQEAQRSQREPGQEG